MKKSASKETKPVYKHEPEYVDVSPCEEFYETFSDEEILDIIQNLESSRAVNLKYTYYGVGAKQWNDFSEVVSVSSEKEMLEHAFDLIVKHVNKFNIDKINFIDVGVGNGSPVKKILKKLNEKNLLNKYVGLDISKEMLKYAEKNLREVLPGDKIVMNSCDIERDNIYPIIYKNKTDSKSKICNLIFELGGTIGSHENVSTILENIYHSLDKEDLFFVSGKIINKQNILSSSHLFTPESIFMMSWILQYMGIDTSSADFSYHYDEEKNLRYILTSLVKDYAINFKIFNKQRKVFIPKGTDIRIWNHSPLDYTKVFDLCRKTGFSLASAHTTHDRKEVLIGFSLGEESN